MKVNITTPFNLPPDQLTLWAFIFNYERGLWAFVIGFFGWEIAIYWGINRVKKQNV